MAHPVLGIDHTYLLVNNLEISADRYRRLGFTLSPRGLHSAHKGTANHTIVFRDDYFELLGIVNETAGNVAQREVLAKQGEGIHAIANRTADADAAKEALAQFGVDTGDVSAFSRPLPLPDGTQGIASFRTLTFDRQNVPLGQFFLCQHETRDMVWRPELQAHQNGALALGGIVGIVSDPRQTAETYGRFYADGRVVPAEGGFRVDTGEKSAPLLFVDEGAAANLFPGQDFSATPDGGFAALRIVTKNIDKVRGSLSQADVPFSVTLRGSVVVAPAFASGAIIEFIPQ